MAAGGYIRIKLADESGKCLAIHDLGTPVVRDHTGECQWKITKAHDGYFKIYTNTNRCLDLSNPEQQPVLSTDEDVSGQYWIFEAVNGCKEGEGGMIMRCLLGYTISAMWTGPGKVLTFESETKLALRDCSEDSKQIWMFEDSSGNMWMPSMAMSPECIAEGTPEVAVCDFGEPELEIAEPEIISCDFGRPVELIAVQPEEAFICGGLSRPSEGGPVELLAQVKAKAEAAHGAPFAMFEPVQSRSQVVAGTNHYVKVKIGDDAYAHIVIFEGLGGAEPELSSFAAGKTLADPL